MKLSLASMSTFVELPSARRARALRRMRDVASDLGETHLVDHLDAALAHEREVHRVNRRWRERRRGHGYPVELVELDGRLCHTLSGLRDLVRGYIDGADPGDATRQRAERLLGDLFPAGVRGVASLPYVDKVAAVDELLHALATKFEADVRALHLDHLVERLRGISEMYWTLLDQTVPLTFVVVEAVRERGHGYMIEAVFLVLGRFYKQDDPDHERLRAMLLAPIVAQDRAMRELRRLRRRGMSDAEAAALADAAADADADADAAAADADADPAAAADADADPAAAALPPLPVGSRGLGVGEMIGPGCVG